MASRLVFITQPAHGGSATLLHGTSFETQPVLEAQDHSGARDQQATGQVSLSLHAGNASLAGQTTRSWSSGRADFATNGLSLSANSDGENVVLKAEVPGLPTAFSDTLNVDIRATRLVFVVNPISVRVDSARASTQLRAGGTTGPARVLATAPGLLADTLAIALRPGPVAAIDLSAFPPSIHLDETDRVELSARLTDARGNLVDQSRDRVLFSLSSAGTFASGLSAVNADSGIARTIVTAAGSQAALLTAFLRNSRGQLLVEDSSTRVRFTLLVGHGLFGAREAIARNGVANVELRGLGVAGPLRVRAEAEGLEGAEIEVRSTAAAPHRVDLVALPPSIVADRNSRL